MACISARLNIGLTDKRVTRRRVSAKLDNWLPGSDKPAHLEGLPGNTGFDPLGLGKNEEALKYYVQAELVHCRFAMLGAAGILIPEAFTKAGIWNVPVWYEAGATNFSFADSKSLFLVQLILMGFAETKRYYDFKNPGSQGVPGSLAGFEAVFKGTGNPNYPGGLFDPLGLSKDESKFEEYKVKEIANGRLAMISMLGFYVQAKFTGASPLDNLLSHIADPWHNLWQ